MVIKSREFHNQKCPLCVIVASIFFGWYLSIVLENRIEKKTKTPVFPTQNEINEKIKKFF